MGTDGTVGFVSAWDSELNQVGKGEQEIISLQEGRRVDYEIRFEKPFKNISYAYISTIGLSDSSTEVLWVFKGKRNLLMKLLHLVFNLPKTLGKDLSESLANLKRIMESWSMHEIVVSWKLAMNAKKALTQLHQMVDG